MHPMLQPMFPTKLAIASGAVWCAWTVAAVFVHTFPINAPAPAAADPPQPFTLMVRTIPITPELLFDDRWQTPVPAMQQERKVAEAEIRPDEPKPIQARPRHAARYADPVCGSRGRRYFHISRWLSWRCRR
ncbi:hypothetical protein HAP48_0049065 [Bradyrhizobium septentrionale]|uniref:Uncharacterized protein n=1 Tax=Bradyrhizobium septentrionale TaxID=1404411 RepID=A0A974A421_9BRAD|nr:hypothetical protein [Bradyrhizobium septentrionale]UGY16336.1 hypothetical protein HAP48_0049065 [Bradyrhizobium septentrionale]UGY24679.1 hypothetical protein HU675_0043410 [Bradyrhizobium septentrionale]